MSTITPRFDRYKLNSQLNDNIVTHRIIEYDMYSGTPATEVVETWVHQRKLGNGAFGQVTLQVEANSGRKRAVKAIPMSMMIMAEIQALVDLQDRLDLFVGFMGWYKDITSVFLAMEYIALGDLGSYMITHSDDARTQAQQISVQILQGLQVMHEREICHRDLKPQVKQPTPTRFQLPTLLTPAENVLMASISPLRVKITDFGICKIWTDTNLQTWCGTPFYQAPEVNGDLRRILTPNQNLYSSAVDMWSLGVVVHELLTSTNPFFEIPTIEEDSDFRSLAVQSTLDSVLLGKYCAGEVDFPSTSLTMHGASASAIDFVKSLMVPDPKDRLTATGALRSAWLAGTVSIATLRGSGTRSSRHQSESFPTIVSASGSQLRSSPSESESFPTVIHRPTITPSISSRVGSPIRSSPAASEYSPTTVQPEVSASSPVASPRGSRIRSSLTAFESLPTAMHRTAITPSISSRVGSQIRSSPAASAYSPTTVQPEVSASSPVASPRGSRIRSSPAASAYSPTTVQPEVAASSPVASPRGSRIQSSRTASESFPTVMPRPANTHDSSSRRMRSPPAESRSFRTPVQPQVTASRIVSPSASRIPSYRDEYRTSRPLMPATTRGYQTPPPGRQDSLADPASSRLSQSELSASQYQQLPYQSTYPVPQTANRSLNSVVHSGNTGSYVPSAFPPLPLWPSERIGSNDVRTATALASLPTPPAGYESGGYSNPPSWSSYLPAPSTPPPPQSFDPRRNGFIEPPERENRRRIDRRNSPPPLASRAYVSPPQPPPPLASRAYVSPPQPPPPLASTTYVSPPQPPPFNPYHPQPSRDPPPHRSETNHPLPSSDPPHRSDIIPQSPPYGHYYDSPPDQYGGDSDGYELRPAPSHPYGNYPLGYDRRSPSPLYTSNPSGCDPHSSSHPFSGHGPPSTPLPFAIDPGPPSASSYPYSHVTYPEESETSDTYFPYGDDYRRPTQLDSQFYDDDDRPPIQPLYQFYNDDDNQPIISPSPSPAPNASSTDEMESDTKRILVMGDKDFRNSFQATLVHRQPPAGTRDHGNGMIRVFPRGKLDNHYIRLILLADITEGGKKWLLSEYGTINGIIYIHRDDITRGDLAKVSSAINGLRSILVPYFNKDMLITARAMMVRPSWYKIDKTKLAIKWHGMPPGKDWTEQTISEIKVQCVAIVSHVISKETTARPLHAPDEICYPGIDLSWVTVKHLEGLYEAIGSKKYKP